MKGLIFQLEKILEDAGRIFNDLDLRNETIAKSGTSNYVTQIDLKVQEFLIEKLWHILPGCNIITEESSCNIFELEKPTFILDPVDGTTNLMHDYNHSAISLALVIDGKLDKGIIYNPTRKETFIAEAGKGSRLNDKKIEVSKVPLLRDSLIGFGTTPYDRNRAKLTFDIVHKVFLNCQEIRRSGSAALDLAYVACGRIDGFFELTLQPWDFAAGQLILQEAGGKITGWVGEETNILKPGSVVASNGRIHSEIVEMLGTFLN